MAKSTIQIYEPEAVQDHFSPAFYSENNFTISDPTCALVWLDRIGTENVKHVAKLRFFVSAVYEKEILASNELFYLPPSGPPWCRLFRGLAAHATGLREIYIFWDSERTCGHFGGGADVDVVRALAETRGLQRLEIAGYFAKEWPTYLREKTGLTVWSASGKKGWYCKELKRFQRYTQDLAP